MQLQQANYLYFREESALLSLPLHLHGADFFATELYLNNVFPADIDRYLGELIRKLFYSNYDVASSKGDRTEHRHLPLT